MGEILPFPLSVSTFSALGSQDLTICATLSRQKKKKIESLRAIQISSRNRQKFCILVYHDKKASQDQPRLVRTKIPKSLGWLPVAMLGLEPGSGVPTLSGSGSPYNSCSCRQCSWYENVLSSFLASYPTLILLEMHF